MADTFWSRAEGWGLTEEEILALMLKPYTVYGTIPRPGGLKQNVARVVDPCASIRELLGKPKEVEVDEQESLMRQFYQEQVQRLIGGAKFPDALATVALIWANLFNAVEEGKVTGFKQDDRGEWLVPVGSDTANTLAVVLRVAHEAIMAAKCANAAQAGAHPPGPFHPAPPYPGRPYTIAPGDLGKDITCGPPPKALQGNGQPATPAARPTSHEFNPRRLDPWDDAIRGAYWAKPTPGPAGDDGGDTAPDVDDDEIPF